VSVNKIIFRAGIIPYFINGDSIQYKFMKPSDPKFGGPDWQIAKGRVEGDDDNLSTALREGAEELGLKESNIISVTELGVYMGRTCIFICEIKDIHDFNPFHFETGDVKWLTLNEYILNNGRALHLPIINDAERYIKSLIGDME
jgi:8-oxo-dGTP pyrophosphatase MutT (NUDIX family)